MWLEAYSDGGAGVGANITCVPSFSSKGVPGDNESDEAWHGFYSIRL